MTYQAIKTHPLILRSVYNDDANTSLIPMSNDLYTTWKARNSSYDKTVYSASNDDEKNNYNYKNNNNSSVNPIMSSHSTQYVGNPRPGENVVRRCIDYIIYCPFIARDTKFMTETTVASNNNINNNNFPIDSNLMKESSTDSTSTSTRGTILQQILRRVRGKYGSNNDISFYSSTGEVVSNSNSRNPVTSSMNSDDDDNNDLSSQINGNNFKFSFGHPTTVKNTQQVSLSLALRITIYFFNSLLPVAALFYSDLSYNEVLQVTGMSLLGLFLFESLLAIKSTPFNPIIPSQVNIEIETVAVLPMFSRQKLVSKATALGKRLLTNNIYSFGRPGLQPLGLLDIYTDEEIGPELIPSVNYPSDHLAIAADFQVIWEDEVI